MTATEPIQGTLPRKLVVFLVAAAVMLGLALALGVNVVLMYAVVSGLTSAFAAGLVALSAGGLAWPIVRRIAPRDAPTGLVAITASALGLWILSTLVLAIGTIIDGSLHQLVWWPIVLVGIIMAAWYSRRRVNSFRPPENFDGRVLIWVLIAIAAGFWLAGALVPPGHLHTADSYDVLQYHLQAPREFHHAGQINELKHNCYSYYPLGGHMLFLLQMCLHGGPYMGMYAAKASHGLFVALAVAAVYTSLKTDDEARGRFAAVLLATTPFVVYLSWLAMVELAQLCYLVLALLWLRHWLGKYDSGSAGLLGACLGAACAVKYLSVGLIAGPVLAMMLVFSVSRGRRLGQFALASIMTLLLFSPWLIRNVGYTGNPVFPLMTRTFGRGHWSEESERRWVAGHGPEKQPPVPRPEGWEMPPEMSRAEMFYRNLLVDGRYPPPVMLLGAVGICVLIAKTGPPDKWGWSLVGVTVVQVGVWSAFTHEMPGRFIVPVLAPVCLLGADALGHLSRVKTNPFTKADRPSAKGPWGLPVAAAVLLGVFAVNIASVFRMHQEITGPVQWLAAPGETILEDFTRTAAMEQEHRILMVGDATMFFRPADAVYATVFDAEMIVELLEGGVEEMRDRDITHVLFNWSELRRLSATYGYPEPIGPTVFAWEGGDEPPDLELLDELQRQGLRLHEHFHIEAPSEVEDHNAEPQQPRQLMASLYILPGVEPADPPETTTVPTE